MVIFIYLTHPLRQIIIKFLIVVFQSLFLLSPIPMSNFAAYLTSLGDNREIAVVLVELLDFIDFATSLVHSIVLVHIKLIINLDFILKFGMIVGIL